jgi:SAM-dependent methyltransferase
VTSAPRLAPGIPADYYQRIHRFEERHFLYSGMRKIAAALIGERLTRPGVQLLDAGCGTGGFLRWALDSNPLAAAAGVDIGADAIELARSRVPEAELEAAPLRSLPFEDARFDLVVTNDVLQHVPENDVQASLRELRRVLRPGGTLLAHTNGSRRLRRERDDWRAYDRKALRRQLEDAGFHCERVTHANCVLSLWAAFRGRRPHAPTETTDGIPDAEPSLFVSTVGGWLLDIEARWLGLGRTALPYGYAIFAVASKPLDGRPQSGVPGAEE